MGPKKKVTFDDIAKYTHFSKTTISRYFNHPDSLTLENQKIISDALEKLNYQENKVARILASGKTEFIGLLIPDLYHHYYAEVLNQILHTYETFGYKFLVFTGNENEEIERQYIQELLAYQIEGHDHFKPHHPFPGTGGSSHSYRDHRTGGPVCQQHQHRQLHGRIPGRKPSCKTRLRYSASYQLPHRPKAPKLRPDPGIFRTAAGSRTSVTK